MADLGRDDELVVVGREVARGETRVRKLVEAVLAEADGEGLDGARRVARHQADDRARINPAREERAERHVRDETHAHRLVQERAQLLYQLALARLFAVALLWIREVPILLDARLAAGLEGEMTAGRKF